MGLPQQSRSHSVLPSGARSFHILLPSLLPLPSSHRYPFIPASSIYHHPYPQPPVSSSDTELPAYSTMAEAVAPTNPMESHPTSQTLASPGFFSWFQSAFMPTQKNPRPAPSQNSRSMARNRCKQFDILRYSVLIPSSASESLGRRVRWSDPEAMNFSDRHLQHRNPEESPDDDFSAADEPQGTEVNDSQEADDQPNRVFPSNLTSADESDGCGDSADSNASKDIGEMNEHTSTTKAPPNTHNVESTTTQAMLTAVTGVVASVGAGLLNGLAGSPIVSVQRSHASQ